MKARELFSREWALACAAARRVGGRFRPWTRMRPSRPTAAGTSLTLIAQAVLVAAGSAAIGGCSGPALCTGTPPTLSGEGGQQVSGSAGGSVAGVSASAGAVSLVSGRSSQQASATRVRPVSTVTLPTGEQVQVTAAGSGAPAVTPLLPTAKGAGQGAPGFVRLSFGGDEYVIPDEAVPYLGSALDPRLFDVSYLARAGLAAHGPALPLTVTYRGGSAPSLPGFRVTHASGGAAAAALVPARAAQFGQLLARRWRAGQAGLPGMARISLAQPAGGPSLPAVPLVPVVAPSAGTPQASQSNQNGLAYHTLTVKFAGLSSQASEVGMLQNVGDARLGTYLIIPDEAASGASGRLVGQQGPFSFSVPDGTYSLIFGILTPHPGTYLGDDAALVAQPQFTVSGDQTVTLDASTARPYQAQLATPVTASVRVDSMDMFRASTTGGGCGGSSLAEGMGLYSVSGDGYTGSQLSASPTSTVTQGAFYFDANSALSTGPASAPVSKPQYYLDFPNAGGVPSSLTYTVPEKDLITVNSRMYASPLPGSGQHYLSVRTRLYHPWLDFQNGEGGNCEGSSASEWCMPPGDRTDYRYSSDPQLSDWQDIFGDNSSNGESTATYGPVQPTSPGQQITETWNKAPIAPSPAAYSAGTGAVNVNGLTTDLSAPPLLTVATASRQGDIGELAGQLGDSDPTNDAGDPNGNVSGTWSVRFYRNGVLADSEPDMPGRSGSEVAAQMLYYMPMLSQPATYQLEWSSQPASGTGSLGEPENTDWAFRSAASDPAATLPKTEECPVDASRGCSFLPLLFIGYDLPLNFSGQARAGQPFNVTFTVEHQQYQPPPAGVSATVSASFDDGKTWTAPQAAASQGGDRFTAMIGQPALAGTTGFVSLKIHAKDGAGNSVDQTIIRAYGLTG